MIRFVLGPDGGVVPDIRHRLPGRGIWVTATREALVAAIAREVFARGFKRDVSAPKELAETTERLLERSALDALAITHKAGRAVIGFARVEAALASAPVSVLIHAMEAASTGTRKLAAALGRRHDVARIALIGSFTSPQLDLALARANVVHAALLAGPESDLFVARTARLDCFRAGPNWRAMPNVPGSGKEHIRTSVESESRSGALTERHGKSENR
jgi:predicted RNA-binding protein YlxR (DUF448 family)